MVGWLSIQPKMTRRPRESVKDWDAMKLCEASTMPAVPSQVQFHAASQCPVKERTRHGVYDSAWVR